MAKKRTKKKSAKKRGSAKTNPGLRLDVKALARKDAEKFFHKHAGFSYDPKKETRAQGKKRSAARLAKAEQWAWYNNYDFVWEEDPDGWDLLGDVDPSDVSEVLSVRMVDSKGNTVQALGGVLMGHDSIANRNSGRVFEAELALEQMSEKNPKRKSKAQIAKEWAASRSPAAVRKERERLQREAPLPEWRSKKASKKNPKKVSVRKLVNQALK